MLFARLLAGLAALLLVTTAYAAREQPRARAGVLDLRDWSFPRDGIVDLAGEWDLAWGRFEDPEGAPPTAATGSRIAVPAPWNDAPGKPPGTNGYGTYRLRVECSETARLSLVMPVQHSAVRLYVNGKVVALQGAPGQSPEVANPAFVQQVAPLGEAACPLVFVAHVSNYDMRNGGLLRSLELGTERQLAERRERGLARDVFALGGITVLSLMAIFVYLWRREDRAPLWVGCYGLSSAAFIGLGGERLFQPFIAPLGWQMAWKIAFLVLLSGTAAFPAFVRELYPQEYPRTPFRILMALLGVLTLLVFVTPTRIYTQATPMLYAISALLTLLAVIAQVRAALHGREGAWLLLAGTAVLVFTAVHDTVLLPYNIAGKLSPYGLLFFAITPAVLLARRFARALRAEELRTVEQEQRVDMLVNATKAGLLDTDVAARRTTYSERLKEMLGYPPDADASHWPPFFELTHPADRERIHASFASQMRDRSVASGVRRWSDSPDFRVRRADGSYIWIHGEAISITGADGRTLRHICSFVDITERKNQELELADRVERINNLLAEVHRGEEALRESDARYDVAMRAINEGVYDWNVEDGTIFYSEGVYRVLGVPDTMKTPEDWRDRVHAEDRARYDAAILAHFKGETERFECEYRFLASDGSWRWARQHGLAIRNREGRAIRMVGSTGDITERYAMQEALARERERLALLVRATKAGFVDWDAATDTYAYSERFKEMLGYPGDTDTSDWPSLYELMHPDERDAMRATFLEILRHGSETGERIHGPIEHRLRRADGSYLWVRGEGIAQVGPDGRTHRFLVSYIDITHLREMNLALAESVRLREEVDRIGRHDLKTPLNSVIAIPRLMRETGRLNAEDNELLAFVEQAGMRLLDLVNLSLDMFRMEQGNYPFRPQAVDLRELLSKVARDLRAHADSKHVVIRVEGPALYASGEELLCYSMFGNLAKNALEASPEGGELRMTMSEEEGGIRVDIHNAGAVPEAIRAKFFEKYSTAGKSGGTGLGTYSARLMARTQGGDISLRTSEAHGTTLSVFLKTASAAAIAALSSARTERTTGPRSQAPLPAFSVLVVDDDEYNLVAMRRYLPSPLRVTVAVNGRAALEAVMADPPDVIVMDLDMPVMGGLEAAKRIRAWEEAEGLERRTMIAMSAHDDPRMGSFCLEAGFDRFIVKPVTADALRQALAAIAHPGPDQTVRVDADLESAVPGFLKSRRALIEELSLAIAAGEGERARATAHKLAGGFSLYGFLWASGHSRMIERRAKDGALEDLAAEVDLLRRHLDTVRVEFRKRREEATE